VLDVVSGVTHTCALLAADGGTVSCWGLDADGELGNQVAGRIDLPAAVPSLAGVTRLVAGQYHTCATLTDGGVQCWGENQFGQLGNGAIASGSEAASPTPVTGLASPTALSLGYDHSCAVAGGSVLCWGMNGEGQLGTNAVTQSDVPLLLP
jgi:alpha-tubulin suppressor-like RCC1 family protein